MRYQFIIHVPGRKCHLPMANGEKLKGIIVSLLAEGIPPEQIQIKVAALPTTFDVPVIHVHDAVPAVM